ncbi:Mitotic spindle-associated MMXD complex subunit MIP18 [Vanrija pseudolonga]|uniref:Mitotic spindle-associated MMXD complex subunit MIP18 n=1 Tax=Vanrija pseudolonga TaxID=143232 RepID=A0AAF0Y6A1_9TREE|nr:Mitotic spindle-associated MMXD complex subunit MIP18 [Vanrija pseudolonga]
MSRELDNAAPTIFATSSARRREGLWGDAYAAEAGAVEAASSDEELEEIDAHEVFDLLRSITDPEHPVSLEQLRVVSRDDIHVGGNRVLVYLTPTIPHCSMSTLIGLSLRVRLLRALPSRYRVDIRIKEGTHQSEHAVNKQLNDKERVQAALENSHLLQVVEGCLATAGQRGLATAAAETE